MLDITNKRIVTTRKVHECFGCTEPINKGESAIYVMAKEDEQRMRFHLHRDCNKKIAKDKQFSGSGLYYGCIKEADNAEGLSIEISLDEEYPFL